MDEEIEEALNADAVLILQLDSKLRYYCEAIGENPDDYQIRIQVLKEK